MLKVFSKGAGQPVMLHAVAAADLERFLAERSETERRWLTTTGFKANDGELALIPGAGDGLAGAVMGLGAGHDPLAVALFSERLPAGDLRLRRRACRFRRRTRRVCVGARHLCLRSLSREAQDRLAASGLPAGVDGEKVSRIVEGVFLARDLVNTPSNDMGPAELEAAARALAEKSGAGISVTTGEALLDSELSPGACGRPREPREPRLIDLTWGPDSKAAPKVTLVGKGVCFDSGGLDLKNSSGMLTMKKDMGGAACVLGLASMIMAAKIAGASARPDPRGREQRVGFGVSAGRRPEKPQGADGRDRQHRRRRAAGAGRCADRRRHRKRPI